tara:strand:+ start:1882 stop:2988 length:1107 start_codon:yes stop_codon:yes gene_type:complete
LKIKDYKNNKWLVLLSLGLASWVSIRVLLLWRAYFFQLESLPIAHSKELADIDPTILIIANLPTVILTVVAIFGYFKKKSIYLLPFWIWSFVLFGLYLLKQPVCFLGLTGICFYALGFFQMRNNEKIEKIKKEKVASGIDDANEVTLPKDLQPFYVSQPQVMHFIHVSIMAVPFVIFSISFLPIISPMYVPFFQGMGMILFYIFFVVFCIVKCIKPEINKKITGKTLLILFVASLLPSFLTYQNIISPLSCYYAGLGAQDCMRVNCVTRHILRAPTNRICDTIADIEANDPNRTLDPMYRMTRQGCLELFEWKRGKKSVRPVIGGEQSKLEWQTRLACDTFRTGSRFKNYPWYMETMEDLELLEYISK